MALVTPLNNRDYRVRKAVDQQMARRAVGSSIEVMVNPVDHCEG